MKSSFNRLTLIICPFFLRVQSRMNGLNSVNSVWMNLEQMKVAVLKRELLGLEPYFTLKMILERHAANSE